MPPSLMKLSIIWPTGTFKSSDMPARTFIVLGVTYAVSLTRLSGTGFLPAPGLDPPLAILSILQGGCTVRPCRQ